MYKLHLLIEEKKWPTALLLLQDPETIPSTHQPHKDSLPLHMACDRKAPDELILALLRANEKAAAWKGRGKNLPLHLAAHRNLSFEVVESIIRAYPEALECRNTSNYTPRDYQVKDNQVFQALNRPTSCWIELIEEEEREETQDNTVLDLHKRCDKTLRACEASNQNYSGMLERLEVVRKKMQSVGMLQSAEVESNVAKFDDSMNDKFQEASAHTTIVEEDAKVAYARDKIASAASMVRQKDIEMLQKNTARELDGLRMQVDVLKVAIESKNE